MIGARASYFSRSTASVVTAVMWPIYPGRPNSPGYCGPAPYATFVSANCQRQKFGAPSKRYHNTIVTRSIGLALNGPFCVDPAGRRGFRDPQGKRVLVFQLPG